MLIRFESALPPGSEVRRQRAPNLAPVAAPVQQRGQTAVADHYWSAVAVVDAAAVAHVVQLVPNLARKADGWR